MANCRNCHMPIMIFDPVMKIDLIGRDGSFIEGVKVCSPECEQKILDRHEKDEDHYALHGTY